MRICTRLLLIAVSTLLLVGAAQAATITFFLDGNGGQGLQPGSENPAVVGPPAPGSGGILSGISYDTVTNIITIDIGWGSGHAGQGWNDLTLGGATLGHIHLPTTDPGQSGGFSQNAPAVYNLHDKAGWNGSASNGGFSGSFAILEADEAALLNNQTYINIHTTSNTSGEIRGQLMVVPEPTTAGLLALGLVLVAARRRAG